MLMTRLMMFGPTSRLLATADDGGGGSGGGGGGGDGGAGDGKGGKGDNKDGGDGKGTPPEVSDAVKAFVSKTINGAFKSFETKLEAKIPTADSLIEKMKAAGFGAKSDDSDDGDDDGGEKKQKRKDGAPDAATAKRMATLEADLAATKQKLQQKETESQAAENKRLRDEERAALVSELRKAGIPEARIKGAAAWLHLEAGKIKRDADGEIVWPTKKSWGEDNLSLSEGVAEWLLTDEGKEYLPPVDARGSGASPAKKGGKGNEKSEKAAAAETLTNFLMGGGNG